jgi:guanylate kinase
MSSSQSSSFGKLFVVSAPSGAGKTSIIKKIIDDKNQVRMSISHTTRQPRTGEIDGVDYHFISNETFLKMSRNSDFLEEAKVFDNLYGTSKTEVQKTLTAGLDVILEIDWQGARLIKQSEFDVSSVFILPPSLEELNIRLQKRGDKEETVIRRMRDAIDEMSHYHEYDYLIVNEDFSTACLQLTSIICAQKLHNSIQKTRLEKLLAELVPN